MSAVPEWGHFYDSTKGKQPRAELLQALGHVRHSGKALDIGAGALNETKYLLREGFEVTAVDSEPAAAKAAEALSETHLHFHAVSYENFDFPVQEYDLVAALYALPFTPKDHFDKIVRKTVGSIKPGGIFVGHLFGEDDEWNDGKNAVNFVSETAAKAYFLAFEILDWHEEKGPGHTSTGEMKHWHFYHILARRR